MQIKDEILIKYIDHYIDFYVPPYQRKYKWEWKKEIKEFIDDIEHFLKNKKLDSYFLGSIVLKKIKLRNFYILVDGQQRITTLLLICRALYEISKGWDGNLKYKVLTILEPNENESKLNNFNKKFIINKILKGNINDLTNQEQKSNYFIIYKQLLNYFSKKTNEELENFFKNGIHKIQTAIIILNDEEDEFLVYESINSKGRALSPAELIKNYMIMTFELNNNSKELLNLFINDFEEELTEAELTDLYRQKLTIKTGALFSKSNKSLYYNWKEQFPKEKVNEDFINDLLYDLAIFKYIKKNDWSNKILPLVKSSLMNFYAILHLVVKENSDFINKELEIKNFKNIEYVFNYLSKLTVSKMLCNLGRVESNRSYGKMAFNLKQALKNNDFKNSVREIIFDKLQNTNSPMRMPKLHEIRNGIRKRNISQHSNTLKWTLIAIEQTITNQKLLSTKQITIENIFKELPKSDSNEYLSQVELIQCKDLLNTLGNLSITINKKNLLDKKSNLKINNIIYQSKKWNHNTIRERCHWILEKIIDTWKIMDHN